MAMTLDFKKNPSDRRVGVWMSPTASGALGITDVHEPLADEINNVGGASGMLNIADNVDWNDWSFGSQASETTNQPSLADAGTFQEFGNSNFGGSMSHRTPRVFGSGDLHDLVYQMTKEPGTLLDVVIRIDGDVLNSEPVADGDLVSVYRVERDAETNPFTPGEIKRYTNDYLQRSEFSHMIPAGDQAITAIEPSGWAEGDKGRLRASIQGRDMTTLLRFSSSDNEVVTIRDNGIYEVVGTGTATITISHPHTADTATVNVTVA